MSQSLATKWVAHNVAMPDCALEWRRAAPLLFWQHEGIPMEAAARHDVVDVSRVDALRRAESIVDTRDGVIINRSQLPTLEDTKPAAHNRRAMSLSSVSDKGP